MKPIQPLSKTEIENALHNQNRTVLCFEEFSSTNTVLKEMAQTGAKEGTVLCAASQTGGKGRLGKSFFSPKGSGIYFSLLLRPRLLPKDAVFLTVSAAVAVHRALQSLCHLQTEIKWVNDIYVNNQKLCGILAESIFNPSTKKIQYAILGIGLNLFTPENGFPEEFAHRTTALKDALGELPQNITNKLIAEIINQFDQIDANFHKQEILEEYRSASCLIGKEIEILSGPYCGFAYVENIDENANLVVRLPSNKTVLLCSGDVSIRL